MSKLKSKYYINRELSWLEFNHRVLEEALCRKNPLLERLKFFCIVSSNLDEFFEVRVAGLKQQIEGADTERGPDGMTPLETFQAVSARTRVLIETQYACWNRDLLPALAAEGVRFHSIEGLDAGRRGWVENYYRSQVRPVLTPLGIDPAHPFPQLLNKSLNIIVRLEVRQDGEVQRRLAVVQLPRVLPRLVRLPGAKGSYDYLLLGSLITHYLEDLFPGTTILGCWRFRVTRNSELYFDEEDTGNILSAVENELHNRRKGAAVRLEVEQDCPAEVHDHLLKTLGLGPEDLYVINGPLSPGHLMTLLDDVPSPELRYARFVPKTPAALVGREDLFEAIRERDILLHHPYESFNAVVDFLKQASLDPHVLAIKQTLYRTGGDPRIVGALMDAVKNGKQVTAVVELKARFDEANNILWARRLEEAGVHVLYGLVGYKIHGKMCLVVRRDSDCIRRYLHLSTGNYNPTTAKLYTDIGLLTCHPEFGEDATNVFNLLTGICQYQETRKMVVAPFRLHATMMSLVKRETEHARKGLPARIIARMNALVDPELIQAMYEASTAGVQIDLIVRGVCCLRPGLRGVSENIRVRSIVDRFLEHSRVFYFHNACQHEVYVGSADWMPRNFFKRIEVVFPIEDGNARQRLIDEILELSLLDTTRARVLRSDGTYHLPVPKKGAVMRRSQWDFMEAASLEVGGSARASRRAKSAFPRVRVRTRAEAGMEAEPGPKRSELGRSD